MRLVFVGTLVAALIAGSGYYHYSPPAIASTQPTSPQDLEREIEQHASDNALITKYVNNAPEVAHFPFRSSAKVYRFSPDWEIDAYNEMPDGTLYISYEPPLPPPMSAGHIPEKVGLLQAGVFTPIDLGVSPIVVAFMGTLAGEPVIDVQPPTKRFVLEGQRARSIPLDTKLEGVGIGTNFQLHDGSTCSHADSTESGVQVYANHDGKQRILLTSATVDRTFGGHIYGIQTFSCATFDGDDYLDMNGWLIFRIENGDLHLMARGRLWAAGPHHILMSEENLRAPQAHSAYYLEAIAP